MDLAGGGAGNDSGGLPVDDEPEAVVPGDDGDDLARVDQPDLDLLGSDHDAAAGGNPPLHGYRPGRPERAGRGPADAAQPVPVTGGTGQGMVRASSPSLVMTAIWVPSIRSVTRCPASW